MVFTLHRYILRELLRVFVLTTITLTFVLSISLMVRRIQEFGVGPGQAIHLLGYFVPIMLTVVLPMSALFSAALVYGRFASDNELDACRASGISVTTLVYPGLCLAIAVSITTLILSFHIVPAFVARAEKSVEGNAKQILFRNIQRNGYYELPGGRFRIYAEDTNPATDTLYGVIIVDSKNQMINKRIYAEQARIQIESSSKGNEVTVTARNTYQIDDRNHQQAYSSDFSIKMSFDPLLSDNIKFQKLARLKEIKSDMTTFEPIRKIAMKARTQLATELLAESISEVIAKKDDLNEDEKFYVLRSENRVVKFTADKCFVNKERTITLSPPIELWECDGLTENRLLMWHSDYPALIKFENDIMDLRPIVLLENAYWERIDHIKGETPVPQRLIEGLRLPAEINSKLQSKGLLELVESIPSDSEAPILETAPSSILLSLYSQIQWRVWLTSKDIISEINSRLVFGLGCIPLTLIAIVLGIKLKGGHMLTAFGVSSLPAGALVIFVLSGKQLTKTKNEGIPEDAGILVMWIGMIALTIMAALIYRKLVRT